MELHVIEENFTVCKLEDCSGVDLNTPWCFFSRTDEEISLVCPTARVPGNTLVREDGWRAFRVQGVLDFSLRRLHLQHRLHSDKGTGFRPGAGSFRAERLPDPLIFQP